VQGQVRRRAAHGQVPRHHQVRRAGLDQPLLGRGVVWICILFSGDGIVRRNKQWSA
jgi:hypothetical protein